MKFFGYWCNGILFGCTTEAKKKAEEYSARTGYPVYRHGYKI